MRARRATVRDGRRGTRGRRAASLSGTPIGVSGTRNLLATAQGSGRRPVSSMEGIPPPGGTEGVPQHEGSSPRSGGGCGCPRASAGALRPIARRRGGLLSRSTDPFHGGRGGGPPPGPAFGTSSVSLRFRGPGPVAAHGTSAAATAPDRQRTHRSPRAGGARPPGPRKRQDSSRRILRGGKVNTAGTGAVGCSGRDGGSRPGQ
jgi:hypothetical protein